MNKGRMIGLVLLVGATLALAGFTSISSLTPIDGLDPNDPRVTLRHVEDEVDRRWGVPHILPADLDRRIAETGAVLFDVRESEEYEMGHLPGAVRVDPDLPAAAFYKAYGDHIRGRPVVLYCSVGVRSSQFAIRLAATAAPDGPAAIFNLRGGVFRWVADNRDLVAGPAPGRLHTFDTGWDKLFARTVDNE